ncbi:phage head closure protein [Paenibacillus glycanilyticus]|uniref:phage head closure protein n=1 Tax=Paenibacillus glycanilyticus TaxID=126569 RepID=UPI0020417926|nr:phage head closure protein [Paenibacillus glycanilyticus]MCM3628801.1 phage head closure protein [Paenibacillus glycanilyticus]
MNPNKYNANSHTGRFNKRITIMGQSVIQDEIGNEIEVFTEICKLWSMIKTLRGSEYNAAGQTESVDITRFIIKWTRTIEDIFALEKTKLSVQYKGISYDVKSVINDDELNQTFTIIAEGKRRQMANSISIDDLAKEITKAIAEYTADVTKGIEKEIDDSSKLAVKAISDNSPERTTMYAKGWRRKKITSGGTVKYIVYNKAKPGLTHLLEFGHVKRGGGRVEAKPHIRKQYDAIVPKMLDRIKSIIKNGG